MGVGGSHLFMMRAITLKCSLNRRVAKSRILGMIHREAVQRAITFRQLQQCIIFCLV